MSKKRILIVLSLFVVAITCILITVILLISFKFNPTREEVTNNDEKTVLLENGKTFGYTGFTPVGFPIYTKKQIGEYWETISNSANIYGINTNLENTGLIKLADANLDLPLVLVISHEDLDDMDKINKILDDTPSILFLGIGNEINILKSSSPDEYANFYSKAKIEFANIKKLHPNIQIFTVFQYESLIGKAYLTGIDYGDQTQLIKDWEDYVDFLGFTVYPHLNYASPQDIPLDYFSKITAITNKEFAITETSWPSDINIFNGPNAKYNTDQSEQLEYIEWIDKMNREYEPIFINWLFLNDIETNQELFKGAGLRDLNGDEKPAFSAYSALMGR
jgi:hypothetical protein